MRDLASYTGLQPSGALQQFRILLARVDKPEQPTYLPIETILVAAAMRLVDPSKFGSSNRDRMPTPVPELAALTRRSIGSIHAKMQNLRGGLPNGGRLDEHLLDYFDTNPEALTEVYLLILGAARLLEVGPERLPDFLGLSS